MADRRSELILGCLVAIVVGVATALLPALHTFGALFAVGLILAVGLFVVTRRDRRDTVTVESTAAMADGMTLKGRSYWWMHPAFLGAFAVLPGLIVAQATTDGEFLTRWHTPKYFNDHWFEVSLLLLLVFTVSAILAASLVSRGRTPGPGVMVKISGSQLVRIRKLAYIFFWLGILGYVAWVLLSVARGFSIGELVAILTGTPGAISNAKAGGALQPVAGVTTFAQFAVVAAPILYILRKGRVDRRAGTMIAVLVVISLVRAYVYAERLAVTELLIPILLLVLCFARPRRSWAKLAITALPIWIPCVLLIVFGAFEYERSWASYYQKIEPEKSFSTFATDRLIAYYATSANNSALAAETQPNGRGGKGIPYYTLEWFWESPPAQLLFPYERVATVRGSPSYKETLAGQANPEFNNTGSLLLAVVDYGIVGSVIFWAMLGAAMGIAYGGFRSGRIGWLIVYPMLVVGLLEMGRILYWAQGRAFPLLLGSVIVVFAVREKRLRIGTKASELRLG